MNMTYVVDSDKLIFFYKFDLNICYYNKLVITMPNKKGGKNFKQGGGGAKKGGFKNKGGNKGGKSGGKRR